MEKATEYPSIRPATMPAPDLLEPEVPVRRRRPAALGLRRRLRTIARVGAGVGVALAINLVVLLIAIFIGLYTEKLFWSLAVGEGTLLVGCLVAAGIAALRDHRGQGLGLVAGWSTGYVGLIVAVALVAVAVIVIVVVLWVLWLLVLGFIALLAG